MLILQDNQEQATFVEEQMLQNKFFTVILFNASFFVQSS
jgi:hypothetical protein